MKFLLPFLFLCSLYAQPRIQILDNVATNAVNPYNRDGRDYVRESLKIIYQEFATNDCDVGEGCVKPGVHKLLKFNLTIVNSGTSNWYGPTITNRPDLFAYDPCHQHIHLQRWSEFVLNNKQGHKVAVSGKMGWCIRSGAPLLNHVAPYDGINNPCTEPKLLYGWGDTYGNVACMSLDVTDLPNAEYVLIVKLDPFNTFTNASDALLVPITITDNTVTVLTKLKGKGRY